ncbi:S-adenosyl-L-methionine-dependent methyltransferase [Aspergillus welwitschiae]|uniref:S-adenosyl-L-methionine-dependent methyltransferase n=1 Tax=Aspergillus welwitschiae TaxID=1341132 RepID=A0A3F3PZK1_9EURO|nr:S-adenosyl-L-methionine-dependent methyltransferase [Aspergillus welwitschiae]RDH32301.1 S-adenosyl-L-methionine-dependent methyltransferase [Aspergillus welwitschiae]
MADNVATLTSAINTAVANLAGKDEIPEAARYQLLEAIDKLRVAVEPPLLTIRNFCFGHHSLVAIRVAMGMGIFDAFASTKNGEMTADALNEKTKGDKGLLVRIMRVLCANHIFQETGVEKYHQLPLAIMFATDSPPSEVIKHFHSDMKASVHSYDYFEARGYQNPEDAYDTTFQLAFGTKEHYFEWLQHNPEELHAFNTVMEIGNRSLEGVQWYDYYPWQEKLATTSGTDRVLLVDIGGGKGHDISGFKRKYPEIKHQLIVQDLPKVIEDIQEPLIEGIKVIGYNMFDPQPIKGAKAYYMRTVLHDWPDKQALQALSRVHDAMATDSVLLINENVLPEINAPGFSSSMDIIMMELYGSLERTERQWLALLEKAQFRVVKIWRSGFQGTGSNALFEAVPV